MSRSTQAKDWHPIEYIVNLSGSMTSTQRSVTGEERGLLHQSKEDVLYTSMSSPASSLSSLWVGSGLVHHQF